MPGSGAAPLLPWPPARLRFAGGTTGRSHQRAGRIKYLNGFPSTGETDPKLKLFIFPVYCLSLIYWQFLSHPKPHLCVHGGKPRACVEEQRAGADRLPWRHQRGTEGLELLVCERSRGSSGLLGGCQHCCLALISPLTQPFSFWGCCSSRGVRKGSAEPDRSLALPRPCS